MFEHGPCRVKNNVTGSHSAFKMTHYEIHVSYDRVQTALTIQSISVNDFGTYKINVVNKLGSINEVFSLHARGLFITHVCYDWI